MSREAESPEKSASYNEAIRVELVQYDWDLRFKKKKRSKHRCTEGRWPQGWTDLSVDQGSPKNPKQKPGPKEAMEDSHTQLLERDSMVLQP